MNTPIQIIDNETSEVLEERTVEDIGAWDFYWNMQCDTQRFSYRIKEEADEAAAE